MSVPLAEEPEWLKTFYKRWGREPPPANQPARRRSYSKAKSRAKAQAKGNRQQDNGPARKRRKQLQTQREAEAAAKGCRGKKASKKRKR